MTEEELRQLVRQAIARVQGAQTTNLRTPEPPNHLAYSSHSMFPVASGADEEGPCVIEPSVSCNHCGYCKSLGH